MFLLPGRGKGSHSRWEHPLLPEFPLTFSGKDGDDAKPYLEKQVLQALKQLERLKREEEK
jgi:DNA-directed RNA polymerase subunit L